MSEQAPERLDRVTDEQLRSCTSTPLDLDFWPEDRIMRLMAAELIEWRGLRARIATKLERHRVTSSRIGGGQYKNPVREGYDRGLTDALAFIASITEENPNA